MLITTHFLVAFSLLVIWVPTGMYCRSLKRSASVSALALMREDREAKAKAHPSLAIIPRRHVESKNLDHLDILYLYIHIWTSFWLGIISLLSEQPIRSAIFARIYIYTLNILLIISPKLYHRLCKAQDCTIAGPALQS